MPTPRPTGRTLAQVWADHDSPDWRRSVLLSAGLDHLTIGPGTRGKQAMDPARVHLFWLS